MIFGFTGPRGGMTDLQKHWLLEYLVHNKAGGFHHGACIGADAKAHRIALEHTRALIVVHPPIIDTYLSYACIDSTNPRDRVKVLPRKGYHPRDMDIVNACETLLSTPDGEPRARSGTWFTINYALSHSKPIAICYPDGHVDEWNMG